MLEAPSPDLKTRAQLLPVMLFCPADRPDRFARALAAADSVVVDLEDAVLPDAKERARDTLAEGLAGLPLNRVVVRVNGVSSPWHDDDVAAVRDLAFSQGVAATLMLPKAERGCDIAALGDLHVIALCETAAGVINAADIAAADNCRGLVWGSEDLALSLGARIGRDSRGLLTGGSFFARHQVLFAARASGKLAIDAVFVDLDDAAGFQREVGSAAECGFDGKACIHPSQAAMTRTAFTPPPGEVDWAREVLAASQSAPGVFQHRGQMVDAPILQRARRIVSTSVSALSEEASTSRGDALR